MTVLRSSKFNWLFIYYQRFNYRRLYHYLLKLQFRRSRRRYFYFYWAWFWYGLFLGRVAHKRQFNRGLAALYYKLLGGGGVIGTSLLFWANYYVWGRSDVWLYTYMNLTRGVDLAGVENNAVSVTGWYYSGIRDYLLVGPEFGDYEFNNLVVGVDLVYSIFLCLVGGGN